MNSELNKIDLVFDVVWERIAKLTGWKNYGQLAELLDIKSSSISGAKKRGHISLEWVFKVAQSYNVSTDWLATGDGDMRRGESAQGFANHATEAQVDHTTYEDLFDEIGQVLAKNIDTLRSSLSTDKLLLLTTTIHIFYSPKFIGSQQFRKESIELNIDRLINLALQGKGILDVPRNR